MSRHKIRDEIDEYCESGNAQVAPRVHCRSSGGQNKENEMKKLMFAVGLALAIAGCTTPLKIATTDADGAVREIEVRNADGKIVEVNNDLKGKIDIVKPKIEAEIKSALEAKIKADNFQAKYDIPIDSIAFGEFKEPLSEDDKCVFRAIGVALCQEYTKSIVYPAWAKKLVGAVMPSAKEKLSAKDYAGAREAIWSVESSGVIEVDELSRRLGNRFLNKAVNPLQWLEIENTLRGRYDELVVAKKYGEARKWIEGFAEIRTYSEKLTEAPAAAVEESEDSLKVADGKASGVIGTAAINARLAKLKESLLAALEAARKAELDAKMQKLIDDLTAKVIGLVESGKFDEARTTIRDVALVNDGEWDAKIYASRIGLMNSIVNPNQLKFLKAEAAKKIDGLIAQNKIAEAIKFIDEYPYVHDTYAQIQKSFAMIEKAMKGLKLEDGQSSEYAASRLASVRELMEKRLGKYANNEDYSELEKALGELEKGYVGQHYDDAAAKDVTGTIKNEITEMVNAMYAPLTTWEMNEELRQFLVAKRPQMPVASAVEGKQVAAPQMGLISSAVDYDAQIAMAEAAIAEPSAVYGLEAVLGDYARIMRRAKAGAGVEKSEAETMVIVSIFLNQPQIFKQALTLKADVNAAARRDELVRAPILLAVQLGRIEFVKMLQDAKCKFDVADAKGDTLLHYAAERGNLAVVKAAVGAVKIDAVNAAGETALFTAVRRNQLAVAKVLLALAGDGEAQKKFVAIANGAGETAFDIACKSNAHMLLDALAAAGAGYDEKQLAMALEADCIGAAQWLVEKGLDVNADIVRGVDVSDRKDTATFKYLVAEGYKPAAAKGEKAE